MKKNNFLKDKKEITKYKKTKIINRENTENNKAEQKQTNRKRLAKKTHVKINEDKFKNILTITASVMLALISILSVLYQAIRINYTNNLINLTQRNIIRLAEAEENIDETNKEYLQSKLFSENIYGSNNITLLLSNFWEYEISVNGTVMTKENTAQLCDVENGAEITFMITEKMTKNILPLSVSSKGNVCGGDANDNITSFISNNNLKNPEYIPVTNTEVIDGVKHYSIENKLIYTFTKGNTHEIFRISMIFLDRLDLEIDGFELKFV